MAKTELKAPKRLNKTQRAELAHLVDCVNDGTYSNRCDVHNNGYPDWFLDWPLWSAGENMPGYMPDSPYLLFLTERSARGYCRSLEREPGGSAYVSDMMPVTLREVLP